MNRTPLMSWTLKVPSNARSGDTITESPTPIATADALRPFRLVSQLSTPQSEQIMMKNSTT